MTICNDAAFYSHLQQCLRETRIALGLTQQEVEARGDLSRVVGKWECGARRPTWASLLRWCEATGVSVEVLVPPLDVWRSDV